ncbi:MAG: GGDEF domain-containing protein [Helicobacteraceae bacterium]
MDSNKKITVTVLLMVSSLIFVVAVLIALSSRELGYESAKKQANIAADIVKDALTAHMVNGMMDKRDFFLENMKNIHNVKSIWVVRSENVSNQFGASNNEDEHPKDEIDEQVLRSGKEIYKTNETFKTATIRVSIPYLASTNNDPNCLECHEAKNGDVLGVISMEFDVREERFSTIMNLLKIIATASIFLIIILNFIRKRITPFVNSFNRIVYALKKVHDGDYTVRVKTGTFKEDKEASKWLNEIVEKLDMVLTNIERNLVVFIHNRKEETQKNDKLLSTQHIVDEITELYNFKKTIETDKTKEDIIYRLAQIMKDRLNLYSFVIFGDNREKNERTTFYKSDDEIEPLCALENNVAENCRAQRNSGIVLSDNFPEICRSATVQQNVHYVCIPLNVSAKFGLTIHIVCKNKDLMAKAKQSIGVIKKYFEEAKPVLETKILMEMLQERNFIDGLTGLYNRKYLEEFVNKNLAEKIEDRQIGVMMLDVDHFKMVNDTYGHDIGDEVLKKLASIIKNIIAKDDYAIRLGGEEFLILINDATEEKMQNVSASINTTFAKTNFRSNNTTFNKTVSIGYCFYPGDSQEFYNCRKISDICLYEAKEKGRNRIIKFTPEIQQRMNENTNF